MRRVLLSVVLRMVATTLPAPHSPRSEERLAIEAPSADHWPSLTKIVQGACRVLLTTRSRECNGTFKGSRKDNKGMPPCNNPR
jgi:hypothetical protein